VDQQIHFCPTPDGVRIAWSRMGAGPVLVKAANWLSHLDLDLRNPVWRHWLEALSDDLTLIRYDERGCGLSDWDIPEEKFSFDSWVTDLETVVDAAGLDRFALLGLSQGGPVAIAYAARHPERVTHLVLYGTYATGWDKRDFPQDSELQREERRALVTLTRSGWGRDSPAYRQVFTATFVPDANPEEQRAFNDIQRESTSPANAARFLEEFGRIDVAALVPRVQAPTLVLHARDDLRVPFEAGRSLAARIPHCRFVPLEGRNHILLPREPAWETFVTEVRRFLGVPVGKTSSGWAEAATRQALKDALPPQYELGDEIASGGMGTVYAGRDRVLDRKVAIKVLRPELTGERAAKRLVNEARILARFKHPNLVTVYHAGELGDSYYYIMDFVDGETLRARLRRGPLAPEEFRQLADDLLAALQAAHEHGVVHRDVKPSNIFMVGNRALLGDFGIAKHRGEAAEELTEPGRPIGTPGFMAPEQAAGEEVTAAADIYTAAMVLYESATGRQWKVTPAASAEADWSAMPGPTVRALRRALAWSPADRWPDAATFRRELLRERRRWFAW